MSKKKVYEKITKKHIEVTLGIIIILICMYGVINYTIVSNLMTYGLLFLFGNLYIFVYLFIMYLGISLILKGKIKKIKFNFIFTGLIFLIISIIMMLTLLNPSFKEMKFTNFDISSFVSFENMSKKGITFSSTYGSGFIGIFIVTLLNSIFQTYYVTWVFCGLFFVLSFIFIFYYPIKKLILYIKNNDRDSKFKKAKNIEEDTSNNVNQQTTTNTLQIENKQAETIEVKEEPKPIYNDEVNIKKPTANYNSYFEDENYGIRRPKFNMDFVSQENIATPKQNVVQEEPKPIVFQNDLNKVEPKEDILEQAMDEETSKIEDEIDPMFSVDYDENEVIEDTLDDEENAQEEYLEDDINVDDNISSNEEFIYGESIEDKKDENVQETSPQLETKIVEEKPVEEVAKKEPIKYFVPTDEFLEDHQDSEETILKNKEINDLRVEIINKTFDDFKVGAKAISYTIGPSVTRFDIAPNADVSITVVEKYLADIARNLGGLGIRFERIVPGKTTSAIEVPNEKASIVGYKSFLSKMKEPKPEIDLNIPFGIDINGNPVYANLANFPHMLISGASGSGKSVYIHSIIMTLILRNSFENLKLLLVDPKDVEFSKYNGIPHLLSPNISDANKAKMALDKLCDEMDYRYAQLKETGASKLEEYNEDAPLYNLPKLPYIVCVLDEYADLMSLNKDITMPVCRLAQKARAAGIHIIICTQRPSAEIVSGVLKSNITVRAALMASAAVDSRIMFDQNGAEELIGYGDMLVSCSLISKNSLVRVQSPLLNRVEIRGVVNYLKDTYGTFYDDNYTNLTILDEVNNEFIDSANNDPLYPQVKEVAYENDYLSISQLCNRFKVGYNRAKRLYSQLQKDGIIDSSKELDSNNKGKKVLAHSDEELKDLQDEKEGLV